MQLLAAVSTNSGQLIRLAAVEKGIQLTNPTVFLPWAVSQSVLISTLGQKTVQFRIGVECNLRADGDECHMNSVLVALITSALAAGVAAQATVPNQTAGAADASDPGAQTGKEQAVNVQKSKEASKMTNAEKNKTIKLKDVNKQMVNPENPAGSVAGTSSMQKTPPGAPKVEKKVGDFPAIEQKIRKPSYVLDK